jgi:oxalate decarboxylase/phosphoglucose isomerase-like protein (cupin superfamily)
VFASGGKARTFNYQASEVGYVPFATGHYIEKTGDETLRHLEMFRSTCFADISLVQWMAVHAAGACEGSLESGPKNAGCSAQGQTHHRTVLPRPIYRGQNILHAAFR